MDNNFLKKILKTFTDKKFRYGAFSSLTAAVVIAVLVLVNAVAGRIGIKFDLTSEKLYSLSDTTINFIRSLDEEVTIYALYKTGAEDKLTAEILEQYASHSDKITVVHKDPYVYPSFVAEYTKDEREIAVNSLIVESGKRYKIIPADTLITYDADIDWNTLDYQEYASTLDVEPKVTNAVSFVTAGQTYKIYALSGHNEYAVSEPFVVAADDAGFSFSSLNLYQSGGVPADCDVLIITTPERDISVEEKEMLAEYLSGGGAAFIAIDYIAAGLDNIKSLAAAYGLGFTDYIICEGDSNFYYNPNYYTYIFPQMGVHPITSPLIEKAYFPLITMTQGVTKLDIARTTTTVTPILTTTAKSYGKVNKETTTALKEEGDPSGPFTLAAAVTDNILIGGRPITTRLVVMGTCNIFSASSNQAIYGNNADFFVNSLNWLVDRPIGDSLFITPKNLATNTPLVMSASAANALKVISTFVIPGLIFAAGIFVWLRRRNK